jgi:phosphatidylserine/phosphatidylglycerophosphate/cardiolipin synthase-like enzyme
VFLGVAGLLAAACSAPDSGGDDASQDELSRSDATVVSMATSAKSTVYANLSSKPSRTVVDALVDAAKRGVQVRALLAKGEHDATWMTQQQLESNGVDVDVRSDQAVTGVLVVADREALVPSGRTTRKETDPAALEKLVASFVAALDPPSATPPEHEPALIRSGAVAVLPMPDSKRGRIVDALSAATTSIDLEIYQLQDRGVIGALEAAAQRRVKVRVMLEPRTVGGRNYDMVAKELAAAKIEVTPTPPAFDSAHNVDHAKFIIIDGKELLFGTGNLVRSGLGGVTEVAYDNRDFWIEDGRAASVAQAQAVFDADLSQTDVAPDDVADLVLTPSNAEDRIHDLIDGAKTRLLVYNQSLDDDVVVAKLLAAKKRGVDVRVLLGYQPGFGGPTKNQEPIDQLTAGAITADFLTRSYLHAKGIVADDRVYLGSQNFTNGGLHNNRELGEILDDAAAVRGVAELFEDDAAHPHFDD